MKPTELMLGDWVQTNLGQVIQVGSITEDEINLEWDGNENYGGTNIKEIEPIPLTPEILEKNGFTWNDEPLVQYWTGYGLIIDQSGSLFYIRTLSTSVILHSVHELQHLLKMFNINKEIEL